MELPREIQLYIFNFLYDKWRPYWKNVMQELSDTYHVSRTMVHNRLVRQSWNLPKGLQFTICLDCGNFYALPMYSTCAMYCNCP
jgi:hypothetical protein